MEPEISSPLSKDFENFPYLSKIGLSLIYLFISQLDVNKKFTRFKYIFFVSVSTKLTLAPLHSTEACHYTYMMTINNEVRQGRTLKGLETCETGTGQQVT